MAKQQFNKLIWLIDTIYRNGRITFAEINRRWKAGDSTRVDIPLRTFHNHRQAIEEMFDINIDCDKSTNTYFIADAEGMLGDKLKMWLLNSFSLNNLLQENVNVKNRILFEDVPAGLQYINTIIQSMCAGCVLSINYRAFNWEKEKEVRLEPYFLKLFRHRWYLIGINQSYQAFRAYALDRIQSVQVTAEPFYFSRKVTPESYFSNCFGIICDQACRPQRTIIRSTSGQAPYLRHLPLHSSQREVAATERYVDFELYISHTYDFIQELLSKGAGIEVIEPESLRRTMRTEIQKMLKLY